ncbi:hypothetical protein pb186bvf_004587 [Paramecium bursaria]
MEDSNSIEIQNMSSNQNIPLVEDLIQKEQKQKKEGIISKLFFYSVYPIMKLAKSTPLEPDMIPDLEEENKSQYIHSIFKKKLDVGEINLRKALAKTFRNELILIFIILFVYTMGQLAIPVLIKYVIDYIMDPHKDLKKGGYLLGIIIGVRLSNIFTQSHSRSLIRNIGYEAMTVVSLEIMAKALKVSFQSNRSHTNGQVLNLMQVDAAKLILVTTYISSVALIPLQLGVSFYLMYRLIGISFVAGLIIIFLAIFVNVLLGRMLITNQNKLMKDKDQRTKAANELFSNIKFIKINALEEYFYDKLQILRKKEVSSLRKRLYSSAANIFTVWLTPQMVLTFTFGLYVYLGHDLVPSNTFAIISLFQMLQQPMLQLPIAFNSLIETNIALLRIQKFLRTKELQRDCIQQSEYVHDESINIKQGNFQWPSKQEEKSSNKQSNQVQDVEKQQLCLKEIDIKILPRQFISIIGDVGSGKSSLLQCLLGEMLYDDQNQPEICINGRIAYVSQKPWIQNSTLKENILFGNEFDQEKYDAVLRYSCLIDDLNILMQGDQTMIGEKGINLSGGQKARVSLARALYQDCDIYLFDDLISAVDIHVGKFIIQECLNKFLKNKTRILVTHQINFCKDSDIIYLMEDGKITERGSYDEMKQSPRFQQINDKFNIQDDDKTPSPIKRKISRLNTIQRQIQSPSESTNDSTTNSIVISDDVDKLMLAEDRAKGTINKEILKEYFRYNGGVSSFIYVAFIMVVWIGCYLGSSLWIADWCVEDASVDKNFSNEVYFWVYFSLGFGQALFAFMRAWTIINQSIKSAETIHNQMVISLMYAPQCQFFERVPQGRIMNRLTKDLNTLDSEIYWNISWLYTKFSQLLSNSFLNVYASTYYILLPILIFFYLCLKIQRIFMCASRELYRLELISKSPILSYFTETLQGLTVIRAFQKEKDFQYNFSLKMDVNRKIFFQQVAANAWFIQVLGLSSFIVNISAIAYCIFYNTGNAAFAGLLMTYASNIDTNICQTVESIGQLENGIISFERCLAYTKVQPEKPYKQIVEARLLNQEVDQVKLNNWPQNGRIEYQNAYIHYREDLPPALKNLNLVIQPKTKIGVVGRTGAGKSTITMSLLRILEASNGQIIIDGHDIKQIPLRQLRENITIIMQDSTIFDGTLRENLDPTGKNTDDEILSVVDRCCLQGMMNNSLDTKLSEGGENLSAGQKQLLCIARAILRKSQIVLIDEATANIDIETEHNIQETIKKSFKNCTVITIAHRINTILHCDKILMIDKGQLLEYGDTQELLEDEESHFYQIYQESLKQKQ